MIIRGAFGAVLAAVLLATAAPGAGAFAAAQSVAAQQPRPGAERLLESPVTLPANQLRLSEMLSKLAAQLGAKLRCERAIADRELIPCIGHTSLKTFLTAICALEGWAWHIDDGDTIIVMRAAAEQPIFIAGLPAAIWAALPADMRTYTEVDVVPYAPYASADGQPTRRALRGVAGAGIRMLTVAARADDRLFDDRMGARLAAGRVAYGELSVTQRADLLRDIFFRQFGEIARELLWRPLPPYAAHPEAATIELVPQDFLSVGTHVEGPDASTYSYFGTSLRGGG